MLGSFARGLSARVLNGIIQGNSHDGRRRVFGYRLGICWRSLLNWMRL